MSIASLIAGVTGLGASLLSWPERIAAAVDGADGSCLARCIRHPTGSLADDETIQTQILPSLDTYQSRDAVRNHLKVQRTIAVLLQRSLPALTSVALDPSCCSSLGPRPDAPRRRHAGCLCYPVLHRLAAPVRAKVDPDVASLTAGQEEGPVDQVGAQANRPAPGRRLVGRVWLERYRLPEAQG
jgi:hypothetical protein